MILSCVTDLRNRRKTSYMTPRQRVAKAKLLTATIVTLAAFTSSGQKPNSFTTLCDVFCNPGPSDRTVFAGQSATFVAFPDGTPPYTMQWKKNGIAIPGATSWTYSTPPADLIDEGTVYTLVLSNEFSTNQCSATLHVGHNPVVVSCGTRGDPGRVYVLYNKPVQLDGIYSLVDNTTGSAVNIATLAEGAIPSEVILTTGALAADHAFTLTITGVHDDEDPANLLEPNPTVCRFTQELGRFSTDFEMGLPTGTTSSGTSPPNVVDGSLRLTLNGVTGWQNFWIIPLPQVYTFKCFRARWQTLLNGPIGNSAQGFSFSVGQNVGFPIAAEEGGRPGLSVTVDTFNNAFVTPDGVGIDIRWNGDRLAFAPVGDGMAPAPAALMKNEFVDASVDVSPDGLVTFNYDTFLVSAEIPNYAGVTANQYIFAARTGGAGAQDTWIDNVYINDYTLGPIAVSVNPSDTIVTECSRVTFTAVTTGSPCHYYQWFSNGVAIAEANRGTYTTPVLLREADGAVYSVVASNDFSNATGFGTVRVAPGRRLAIVHMGDGSVTISWVGSGCRLESSATIGTGANWEEVALASPYNASRPVSNRFYRLVSP